VQPIPQNVIEARLAVGKWHEGYLLFYLESQPGFLLQRGEVVRWVLSKSGRVSKILVSDSLIRVKTVFKGLASWGNLRQPELACSAGCSVSGALRSVAERLSFA